jgi:hypothetical protein
VTAAFLGDLALLGARLGMHAEAARYIARAEAMVRVGRSATELAYCLATRAEIELHAGDVEAATASLDLAERAMPTSPSLDLVRYIEANRTRIAVGE